MSESVETTLEEAGRCPRCKEPGEFVGEQALNSIRGAKSKTFACRNSRCKWYNTSWVVQVNANGTIPPPLVNRPKRFSQLPDDGGRTVQNLEHQLDLETRTGAEVPKRY